MTFAQALPWTDRTGRAVPLKALAFACAMLPGLLLLGEWLTTGLGAEPLKAAIHTTGLWTIRFLLITLAVSPARSLGAWPELMQVRRMLGVTALAYGLLHLSLYTAQEGFQPLHIAAEIVSRIYLLIGFVALLGLLALGITSTNGWMKSLGRRWKHLHRLSYPIAALGLLHYFMQSKANVSEPVFTAGLFVWVMLWRELPPDRQRRFPVLLGIGLAAAIAAALLETGWYAVATRAPAERIFAANWMPEFGLRPAGWVLIATGAVALAAFAWRRLRPEPARRRGVARA